MSDPRSWSGAQGLAIWRTLPFARIVFISSEHHLERTFRMGFLRNCCLLWIVGACFLAGCGGRGDRPQLGTVTGTVYLDDKPLPNVVVMFSPTSGKTSVGRTNERGQYELSYLERVKGANIGTHTIMIQTYGEDELQELRGASEKPVEEPIPAKYNSKSTLKEEVKQGKNVIDFRLESK